MTIITKYGSNLATIDEFTCQCSSQILSQRRIYTCSSFFCIENFIFIIKSSYLAMNHHCPISIRFVEIEF